MKNDLIKEQKRLCDIENRKPCSNDGHALSSDHKYMLYELEPLLKFNLENLDK